MGAVYRARDAKLGRDVAVKVLLAEVAGNPERLARFQREAQVLASLNHPHIAAIYGLEESDGMSALVMELVEGEDLSDRIGRGPVLVADALQIARQIADALETAHDHGIVHRDLKPANIKVRADGTVKVLDFGLAKAMDAGSTLTASSGAISMSPTLTSPAMMTGIGVILGTAAYMSPEQARGATVDRRADLWAFGVILFEMLTGRRLFDGTTVTDTLAAVLKSEPDWSALPPDTPAPIRRLLRRCLKKDRRERLDSAADARLEIEEARDPSADEPARITSPARGSRLPWLVAAIATVAALALLASVLFNGRRSSAAGERLMEFEITPPDGTTFGRPTTNFRPVAVSPDGTQLALVAAPRDGKTLLYIRPLGSNTPRVVTGTENAVHPFWSADGKWIGFLASGKIKRVDVTSGQVQTIGDTNRPGGAFGPDGMMLLTRNGQPLLRASMTDGTAAPLFPLDPARKETGEYDPVFLPDGKHLIYIATGPEMGMVYATLDGSQRKFLFQQQNSPADYAPDPDGGGGLLIYSSRGRLLARRFDSASGDVRGEPVQLAANVLAGPTYSVSGTGVLTYRHSSPPQRQLVWFTRDGKEQDTLGDVGQVGLARVGPDGHSVLVVRTADENADIWLESPGAAPTRLTFEPGPDGGPLWSPDGQRMYYASMRDNVPSVVERPATGLGAERVLLTAEAGNVGQPTSISRDGRWLVLLRGGAGQSSLAFLSLTDGKIVRFPEAGSIASGSLSPDGRWLAYEMISGSGPSIFVKGVPSEVDASALDTKREVSVGGGSQPIWRADGKEITYLTADGTIMSVPVEVGDRVFRAGTPRALFKIPEGSAYSLTPDGQRVLVNRSMSQSDPPVTVVVNWTKLLSK